MSSQDRAPLRPTGASRSIWREIRPVLARWRLLLAGMALLVVAAVALELAPPFLLREIVDGHLKTGAVAGLGSLAWLYLAATIGIRVVAFLQTYATAVIGQRVILTLRLRLVEQLGRLPIAYFDRTPVGDTMSRCTTDVEAVNTLFTSGAIGVITDLFRLVGVGIAMVSLDWRLASGTFVVLPLVFGITEYFRRNIRLSQRGVRAAMARTNAHLQETWAGRHIVYVFGRRGHAQRALAALQAGYHRAADHGAAYNAYFPGVLETLRALTIAGLLWVAASPGFLAAGLTVGDLAAFALLIGRMFAPIQELSQQYQTVQEAMAGLERIAEVLAEQPEDRRASIVESGGAFAPPVNRAAGPTPSRVELRDVDFGYHDDRPVLRRVSTVIEPGQKVAIVGRTGAGKSSVIRLLAGLNRPWSGVVTIDGIEPITLVPQQRRRLLGIVPQQVHLFPGTVRHNIALGDPAVADARIDEVLELVGGDRIVKALPDGLETMLGPGGLNLSYGQSQVICLARAVLFDPPLLLLDEPTSGVDTDTEELLHGALELAGHARTLVLVSHRLSGLQAMDRVIVMAAGRIVEDGTPGELAGRGGWFSVFRELEALGWKAGGPGV